MVPLTALLIPVAASAVIVFLASFVLHMLLEFWHDPTSITCRMKTASWTRCVPSP